MRNWINLTESLARWHNETTEEPDLGAGKPISVEDAPSLLLHGTNFVAAAAILRKGHIEADFPVDDDDLGAVVCVTSSAEMARNFATEFARFNSEYDVGAIFGIDGKKVAEMHEVIPYHAETASEFEYEYRVIGDIPLSICTYKVVGMKRRLSSARFLEKVWDDMHESGMRRLFLNQDDFEHWVSVLLNKA